MTDPLLNFDGKVVMIIGGSTGGGAIVNTASIAGLIADPGMAPYVSAPTQHVV